MTDPLPIPGRDPRFHQNLPGNEAFPADRLTRLPSPREDVLLYRDPDSGTEYLVPNVLNNQGRAVNVQVLRFSAQRARGTAARWCRDSGPGSENEVKRWIDQAVRLEGLADELEEAQSRDEVERIRQGFASLSDAAERVDPGGFADRGLPGTGNREPMKHNGSSVELAASD